LALSSPFVVFSAIVDLDRDHRRLPRSTMSQSDRTLDLADLGCDLRVRALVKTSMDPAGRRSRTRRAEAGDDGSH